MLNSQILKLFGVELIRFPAVRLLYIIGCQYYAKVP
jgi:hypothetical protein